MYHGFYAKDSPYEALQFPQHYSGLSSQLSPTAQPHSLPVSPARGGITPGHTISPLRFTF